MSLPTVKVAAAHAASVYMNKAACVDKACSFIAEAAANGAELVVFPESFIPGFPVWAALWAPIYNHDWFKLMVENSVMIDGPEITAIRSAARRHGILVSLGFSEATPASVGCIWNSNVLISEQGTVLNHHRKLVPTFYEKMVWAPGDGHGLRVSDTRIGKIGTLICGENTNPWPSTAWRRKASRSTSPPGRRSGRRANPAARISTTSRPTEFAQGRSALKPRYSAS